MYPYLHDFINDFFGSSIKLPFPMFGFWVAMAFVAAHYTFSLELKRKEGLGLVSVIVRKKRVGEAMKFSDYLVNGLVGFILGFKILHAFFEYEMLVADPPSFIFSTVGSLPGGLAGAALSIYFKYREVKKQMLDTPVDVEEALHPFQLVGNMTMIAAIAGILGAKLFHNLENISDFMSDPIDAIFSFSGLSVFGGLIAGGAAVLLYARSMGLNIIHVADACAPGLMLAYGVGRIGCQLSGDGDWGIPNDSAMPDWLSFLPNWVWAYDYPNNVLGINLKADFISMGYESISGKAWPTPLYESVMSIFLFFILFMLRKKLNVAGQMLSVYLIFSGLERLLIERIRINPKYDFGALQITQAELISVLFIVSGLTALIFLWQKKRRDQNLSTGN